MICASRCGAAFSHVRYSVNARSNLSPNFELLLVRGGLGVGRVLVVVTAKMLISVKNKWIEIFFCMIIPLEVIYFELELLLDDDEVLLDKLEQLRVGAMVLLSELLLRFVCSS